ncbi:sodium-dependent transporter [Parendozoicomonas haliclonae]|uniref:Sodium:neurotransmitter symporter family protein n=1 Tax=Parendozoicomonas haliclonae TaxID=1960125 RepID=A0A1X7ALT4_9GAMM|nr:sodium-dependent transporter [Parendozoicomonas haliclonae]SMA49015.1 Sodium:neurotransmitter symporter family protein [Parendozoicomonas haliclonae]
MDSPTQNSAAPRDSFHSQLGFILACIGSAVGMANIWLFPYRLGQFGGAAFLIPYVLFLLIGVWGVRGEMAFGRAMRAGPLGAFKKAFACRGLRGGELIGLVPVIASLGIAVGYAVVVGWILRFTFGAMTGSMMAAESSGAYFGEIAGPYGSVLWHLLALGITFAIMIFGVARGIERVNKFMMPAFFILFLILAVRVFTLPGAMEGYKYLFIPQWAFLADPKTWVYALGQAFFSLSLAGSGTLVYGSYLKKTDNVVSSARNVAIFDTFAALLAAVVVIPAVFAFGLDVSAGPPLMFITMPNVFKMMPLGEVFAVIFFIAVLFAGISSLMNLMEAPVEAMQQRFGLSRGGSIAVVALVSVAAGLRLEDGNVLGQWMDIVSIYLIPLGALLAAVMFFWVCGKEFAREQVQLGHSGKLSPLFEPMTRYVFCGTTFVVYVLSIVYGGIG